MPLGRSGLLLAALLAAGQIDPRTALLEQDAWRALAAGRAAVAAEAFRAALESDPKSARLHLGAGIAASLERRDGDAKAAFERALGLDPTLTQARALLGQTLYRMGDLAAAVAAYEAVVRDAPADRGARATLDRWHREQDLQGRMLQTVGVHFTVSFEGPAEAVLADRVLESLERAYARIGLLLGAYPTDPIAVVLYTAEQFRDITRSPSWAGGAYDGTIRVPVRGALDRPEEVDRVLSHEFTHALVHTLAARGVPAWLNEGLATALEPGGLAWAERRGRDARAMPLQSLVAGFGRFDGDRAQLAYATSALAARQLLEDVGGYAVANLLRDLGDGADFATAFEHRMQRSFDEFAASLSLY
jgi:tetratricopeptide (TPR) repeat protein